MAREMKDSASGESKLEQYGVWVKVEPQEYTGTEQPENAFELSDLEAPAETQPPQTQASQEELTVEEEKLLDELDTEIASKEESELPEQVAVALDEDRLPGISADVQFPGVGEPGAVETMGEVLPELELDDLDMPSESAPSAEPALELDSLSLEAPREAEGAEIPLEAVEVPAEAVEEELPVLEELPEMEASIPEAEPLSTELPLEEPTGTDVEVDLTESLPQDHFDDLEALEQELAGVSAPASKTAPKAAMSDDVLKRLEQELASIRGDLTQLKKELSGLKKAPRAEKVQGQESGGFFDDEEDETIALTGDELDNILSTAEVTEESAEAAGIEAEELPADVSAEPGADILSMEEPVEAAEAPEPQAEAEDLSGGADTLTLDDGEGPIEVLPDLELEGLGIEAGSTPPAEPAAPAPAAEEASPEVELADLDLSLEPEAAAEAAEVLESLPEAESADALELEPLQAEPAAEEAVLELEEAIPEAESAEPEAAVPAAEEIDLEGLSLEEEIPSEPASVEEAPIELDEISLLTQGGAPEEKEIEISFEDQGAKSEAAELEEPTDAEEVLEVEEMPAEAAPQTRADSGAQKRPAGAGIPDDLKDEIRTVLKYMDQLLEALPEEKIQEFAGSEYFVMYKKLFEDLGLGE